MIQSQPGLEADKGPKAGNWAWKELHSQVYPSVGRGLLEEEDIASSTRIGPSR